MSSATRFNLFIFGSVALLLLYAACGGRDLPGDARRWFTDLFGPKTPRESYRKALAKASATNERDLELWDAAYAIAKTTPLAVELPHREVFSLNREVVNSAQAFRLSAPPGRRLRISGEAVSGGPLFGELYNRENATGRPVATWDTLAREILYETNGVATEELLFLVQAAPGRYANFEVQVLSEPVLLFPVKGKDESSIQSFWGAARDGGRRKHEGNDLFAPRGTELLAVTDGRITRVSNGGLGGKTVWLRDAERNLRYYYAHLDEQLVAEGQYVQRGDVVGTVGNTGNARTTPPHLHFGIYARAAIDPYPFLQRADELPPPPHYPISAPAAPHHVPPTGNHYLRLSPARQGTVVRQLANGEAVTLLGAAHRFYRVLTTKGEIGYVNFD